MNGAIIPTEGIWDTIKNKGVLIPDEWGNHSDKGMEAFRRERDVLIPDEWGNHSDISFK